MSFLDFRKIESSSQAQTGRPFARPLINRYIGFIKTAFLEVEESGLCSESIVDSLARFRPLKRGKTTAREYESVDHVETEVVKAIPLIPPQYWLFSAATGMPSAPASGRNPAFSAPEALASMC